MLQLNKITRLLAATAICCALTVSISAPANAQDKMGGKMMDSKMGGKMMDHKMMDHKMSGGKMAGGKMMGSKMDHSKMMMGKMTAADKKVYMGMSKSEKALFGKMTHMGKM
ncbi:hypothetical protein EON80_02635 [bacterium]|nr:MAG: hypothetical protein EON80_02635 [bacterium]